MLLRVRRIVYLCIFVLLVVVAWTAVHDEQSREVVHKGWDMTTHAFGQGSSFANDNVVDSTKGVDVDVDLVEQPTKAVEVPSPYAYVFYATQDVYACSILVNIRQLRDVHKTNHRIFVLITKEVSSSYVEALERTGATTSLETPPALANGTEGAGYYEGCLLKLYGFRMHQIDSSLKRVVVMDSDQLVLKNLDYLFEDKIEADVAAPRAYWIAKETFSTAFMAITLSDRVWHVVERALENVGLDQYDMDIANELFGDTVLMLPGHFVTLNSHWEDWNLPHWFHQPDAIVAGITNGTHEVVLPATQDLNKRREEGRQQQDYEFESSNHEPASAVSKLRGSAPSTAEDRTKSFPNLPALPKKPDNKLPTLSMEHDTLSMAPDETLPDTIPDIINPSKHSNGKPHLPGGIAPPSYSDTISTSSSDIDNPELKTRKYYTELFELYKQVSVLHFTAMGKPWGVNVRMINEGRPDAHPLFKEQFMAWRKVARDICPLNVVVDL